MRTTVRARVRPSASGGLVEARFRAPAAIRDARSVYLLTLLLPSRDCERDGRDAPITVSDPRTRRSTVYVVTDHNIPAGAPVRLLARMGRACRGTLRGRVDLKRLGRDPDADTAIWAPGRFVGRFTVRLP